jgi:sterol desaturase/sphingolipid hydroxylase (fatty acid hydroxylase superfamily)
VSAEAVRAFLSYFIAHPQFWPNTLPFGLQVVFALIVADLGITLAHMASHRFPFLWRLHEVHHSVTRMYGFNGLMKHPLHLAIEGLCAFGPLLFLGMPFEVATIVSYAIAIQLLLQHSNFDMKLGPLRHVFAWALTHRFHHIKYGKSGDVNFALFLCVWDHLLGTALYPEGNKLQSSDLGSGSRPDYPIGYAAELFEPFAKDRQLAPTPETPAWLLRTVDRAGRSAQGE